MSKKRSRFKKVVESIQKRTETNRKYKVLSLIVWSLALAVGIGVVLFLSQFVIYSVAEWGISSFGWSVDANVANTVSLVISNALALAIMLVASVKIFKSNTTRDEMGLKGWPTWTDILISPIGYIASMIVTIGAMIALNALVPSINWEETQDVGFNAVYTNTDKIITFIALVVIAPVTEELIFRGFLYGKLRRRLSAIPAIIVVSLLFGILHGQWNVGIVVAIMSVFMCIARELTGTIYAGILIHMIRNGLAFYLLYVNPIGTAGLSVVSPLVLAFLL